MNGVKLFIVVLLCSLLCSCNRNKWIIDKLSYIQEIGDSNPNLAINMLDSISGDIVQSGNEYIMAKSDLLSIRLHDKSYIPATSDIKIKKIVGYFKKHGTLREKQEAYYYAGSVYRDLHDMPRSIENFLYAKDLCSFHREYDTLMLRNTYSNLSYIYYEVQDYGHALEMAKCEYSIAKKLGVINSLTILNVGINLLRTGKERDAKHEFSKALQLIENDKSQYDSNVLFSLLYHLSSTGMEKQADECRKIIEKKLNKNDIVTSDHLGALEAYYQLKGDVDSSIVCNKMILNGNGELQDKYDASKSLFLIYNKKGNDKAASEFARLFIAISDTLNLGERQKLAATTNNLYQYHRDEGREKTILQQSNYYRGIAVTILLVALFLLVSGLLTYLYRRKKVRTLLSKQSLRLSKVSEQLKEQELSINEKENELTEKTNKLRETEKQLELVNAKINNYKVELQDKSRQLEEKIIQNKDFIRLLHQAEMKESSEDIINAIKKSSEGRRTMTQEDWEKLLHAVDETYPSFSEELAKGLGRVNSQEMRVFYLMRIGLTNSQIQNLTQLSRTTIWRWAKKFDSIYSSNS